MNIMKINRHLARSILALLFLSIVCVGAGSAQVIDDFETYIDTADLQANWQFASALDTTTLNRASGTQSMRREGFTGGTGSGVSTRIEFSPPLNVSTARGVSLWVRRLPESVDTVRVSLSVRDANDIPCSPQGVPHISDLEWHRINLDFTQWCGSVDLSQIQFLSLNVSNQTPDSGDVVVSYDDIEVYYADVFANDFESGDLSGWSATAP